MATLSSLVNRVRVELGDLGKSFVTQFVADGTTNRFKLHYAPLDGTGVLVFKNGVDISTTSSIEESTGVLVTDVLPSDGDEFTVSGNYYRYFTQSEIELIVGDAVAQHTHRSKDATGRTLNVATLPVIDEYPVTVYAVTLALYTLATDSAFDIDVQAPDGVTIPRTERYRQLMQMVQTRQEQYRDLCVQLGVGMYKMEVFSLRRISKATGRYIPVYAPQEVDDRSYPQRTHIPEPTYGDAPVEWPTTGDELTAYQGRSFSTNVSFTIDLTDAKYANSSFEVKLLNQRGSVLIVQDFYIDHQTLTGTTYNLTFSLTADQTMRLANRTYWSIQIIDIIDENPLEVKGGHFFTVRASEVVL
jgi:hypothetical protein